jgi:hypothetical protein
MIRWNYYYHHALPRVSAAVFEHEISTLKIEIL